MENLFNSNSFMPHGHCYLWRPDVLWLNVGSDALIALSYYSIPFCLVYFVQNRKDLQFNWIVKMFAAFILACGTTHLLDILTVWHPEYGFQGIVKFGTAMISIATAVALWLLVPKALALPSTKQLQSVVDQLREAQGQLRTMNQELEERVAKRTQELQESEAQLRTAKEAAEAANAAKSAFLANMSHEIRTPLGAVLGFSELLMSPETTPSEKYNGMEAIKRNGRTLSGIISNILDLSKIEAGRLEYEIGEVSFESILSEIHQLMELEATGKGIRLILKTEGIVPSVVPTDPLRLRQILINVIGNAIKFTDRGSVTVTVRVSQPSQGPGQLAFTVADTGAGIAKEQIERLFEPFNQADSSITRRFGGTGLGLVLAKRLAMGLGGDVSLVSSVVGIGSIFLVTVNIGEPQAKLFKGYEVEKSSSPKERERIRLANTKVLLVDDSLDNQVLIKQILRLAGAEVHTANNGKEGVEKALSDEFALVLMDLQMPEMDGYEATKILRKNGFARPIIALTAHALKEERLKCLSSGFNEHLTKPIDIDSLLRMVSQYCA